MAGATVVAGKRSAKTDERGRFRLAEDLLLSAKEEGPVRYLPLRYRAWQGERRVEGRGRLLLRC